MLTKLVYHFVDQMLQVQQFHSIETKQKNKSLGGISRAVYFWPKNMKKKEKLQGVSLAGL